MPRSLMASLMKDTSRGIRLLRIVGAGGSTTLVFMSSVGLGKSEFLEHGGDCLDRSLAQLDRA